VEFRNRNTILLMSWLMYGRYTLTQLPAGYLGDRLGPRRVITLGGFISSLSNLVFSTNSGNFRIRDLGKVALRCSKYFFDHSRVRFTA